MMKKSNNHDIAIIGSRGIPNRYGGFEKFTEILSTELVKKGKKVYVSCEYAPEPKISEFKGVDLFYFPIKAPKMTLLRILYEFLYDAYALFWASRKADTVYMLGYSAALLFFIPKLFGKELLVNPDGMEWKRSKFNQLVKSLLKLSENIAVFWADKMIADSKAIKKYLDNKYDIDSIFIPYGASKINKISWNPEILPETIKNLKINPSYYLVVARLEPENNIEMIIEGYLKSKTLKPLIVVGDFADPDYEKSIAEIIEGSPEDKRIVFTGGIYDLELLNMLRQNCYAYLHGHSVGGTNPSLLEGMISKNLIIAHDNAFNEEVCCNNALYFKDPYEVSAKIELIEKYPQNYFEFKNSIYKRAKEDYSWDRVINQYDILFTPMSDLILIFDKINSENKSSLNEWTN
jgi:rhamnosyltransferase